jgi:hypothetical protein
MIAARVAAQPYMDACIKGEPDPPGNALVAVLKGIYENLPQARKTVAMFDALPTEEQRKVAEQAQQRAAAMNEDIERNISQRLRR